jgi:hypothetical protein
MNAKGSTYFHAFFSSPTLVRETFKVTPKMPTYLVAFVISNFQGQRSPNTMHGIYTPPHLVSQTTYGLQFAEQVFEKLDEFTNLPIFSVLDVEKMVSFLIDNITFKKCSHSTGPCCYPRLLCRRNGKFWVDYVSELELCVNLLLTSSFSRYR